MSLFAMNMPESHAELIDWLERHLVGLDLAALVAELSAVHGTETESADDSDATSMVTLLSGRLPEVIESGLSVLDPAQVRSLLRHPRCLLELQELVLTAGGTYWEQRLENSTNDEFQRIADTGWRRMQLAIAPPVGTYEADGQLVSSTEDTVSGDAATEIPLPAARIPSLAPQPVVPSRTRSVWPAVLTTAALLFLGAVGLQQAGLITLNTGQPTPVAQGWGWERPGAIPQEGPPAAYLTALAHAADEWFNKRPEEQAGVAKRIRDFRDGCQILIESPHKPLPAKDREWLVEKCTKWRDQLDAQLASLESGENPLTVRAAADETISKLITAMRSRADEIS